MYLLTTLKKYCIKIAYDSDVNKRLSTVLIKIINRGMLIEYKK